MNNKTILKEASVLLIAIVMVLSTVAVTANTMELKNFEINEIKNNGLLTKDVLFEDSFETYDDFSIDFSPWTSIDVDGDPTCGHTEYSWPNQWEPQAFTIFNPSATSPPMTYPDEQPRTGDKYAACFNANNIGYINDDWMITPQLEPADFGEVSFWGKAFSDQYNYDKFEVGVSITDTNPSSFTIISPVEQPGHTAWEPFTYSLDDYGGESIYIGIHCISVDAWFLMIDDISVISTPFVVDAGGPYEGVVGKWIQFMGTVTGGIPPYTWHWDFGNGDTVDEQNPVYTYNEVGIYDVTLTVTDSLTNTGNDATTANITGPELDIGDISGGLFKINAVIKNNGSTDATGVDWSITLDGGFIVLGKKTIGRVIIIPAGENVTVSSKTILGFGKTVITVSVECAEGLSDTKTQEAFVLLFFIKIVNE